MNALSLACHQTPILSLDGVSYTYPDGTRALNQISLEIPRGSKIAVLGANGAGKSTLFLHLNGILKPQQGQILLEGRPVKYSRSFLGELRSQVGIVFQDPDSQLFAMNVFEDISFGPMNMKLPRLEVKERVERAMEITRITSLKNKPTGHLSYGEKKRVAIAGVLAMEPAVVILDEPTAFLDPRLVDEMVVLFEKLHSAGQTLIMSTHDMDLAYRWADYCYVLNHGTVVARGRPEDIFTAHSVLKENNLQQPWVLKVFSGLLSSGLIGEGLEAPRNEEQLFHYIKKAAIAPVTENRPD